MQRRHLNEGIYETGSSAVGPDFTIDVVMLSELSERSESKDQRILPASPPAGPSTPLRSGRDDKR
jgi:hypothetical protein